MQWHSGPDGISTTAVVPCGDSEYCNTIIIGPTQVSSPPPWIPCVITAPAAWIPGSRTFVQWKPACRYNILYPSHKRENLAPRIQGKRRRRLESNWNPLYVTWRKSLPFIKFYVTLLTWAGNFFKIFTLWGENLERGNSRSFVEWCSHTLLSLLLAISRTSARYFEAGGPWKNGLLHIRMIESGWRSGWEVGDSGSKAILGSSTF